MNNSLTELKDSIKYVLSYLDQILSGSYSYVHLTKLEELIIIKNYLQSILYFLNVDELHNRNTLNLIKIEDVKEIYNLIKNPKKRTFNQID